MALRRQKRNEENVDTDVSPGEWVLLLFRDIKEMKLKRILILFSTVSCFSRITITRLCALIYI